MDIWILILCVALNNPVINFIVYIVFQLYDYLLNVNLKVGLARSKVYIILCSDTYSQTTLRKVCLFIYTITIF